MHIMQLPHNVGGIRRSMNQKKQKKMKKHKRRRVLPVILSVLAALAVLTGVALLLFQTRDYEVKGNDYYGEATITSWIEKDRFTVNTLYTLVKYNFTDVELPSGVESMHVTLKNPWTLRVTVKEKEMAGYVEYGDAFLYFDRGGTVSLRTKKVLEETPYIEGLVYDSEKVQIGKKLPVEDDSIFEKIVEVSKNLKKYSLAPDRMSCEDGAVQIYFGSVKVLLGGGDYEVKLQQLPPILEKLTELYPDKAGTLHLENFDTESESVRFVPDKKKEG